MPTPWRSANRGIIVPRFYLQLTLVEIFCYYISECKYLVGDDGKSSRC